MESGFFTPGHTSCSKAVRRDHCVRRVAKANAKIKSTLEGDESMYSGATGIWDRLREAWRDPMVRKNAGSLMAGKMIGLGLVLLLITKW